LTYYKNDKNVTDTRLLLRGATPLFPHDFGLVRQKQIEQTGPGEAQRHWKLSEWFDWILKIIQQEKNRLI